MTARAPTLSVDAIDAALAAAAGTRVKDASGAATRPGRRPGP